MKSLIIAWLILIPVFGLSQRTPPTAGFDPDKFIAQMEKERRELRSATPSAPASFNPDEDLARLRAEVSAPKVPSQSATKSKASSVFDLEPVAWSGSSNAPAHQKTTGSWQMSEEASVFLICSLVFLVSALIVVALFFALRRFVRWIRWAMFIPSSKMRLVIVAGLFALACCLTITLGRRYYYTDSKVVDNWRGIVYALNRDGSVDVRFSPSKLGPWNDYHGGRFVPAD